MVLHLLKTPIPFFLTLSLFNFVTPFPGTTLLEEQLSNIDWSQGYAGFSLKRANLKLKGIDIGHFVDVIRDAERKLNGKRSSI